MVNNICLYGCLWKYATDGLRKSVQIVRHVIRISSTPRAFKYLSGQTSRMKSSQTCQAINQEPAYVPSYVPSYPIHT